MMQLRSRSAGAARAFAVLTWVLLAALTGPLVVCETGCGKKTPPAAVSSAAEADLQNITRQLRRWIVKNQRPPTNFADFAASAGMEIPPPPPGTKYAIDKTMHVVLENR